MSNNMKAVIFARVSTYEQEKDGQSIEAQLGKMREYCLRNNLEIIKEFEVVESSTNGERPKFNQCLEFIKAQKTKIALVSDKVDRLQRSILDMPKIDALVSANKMALHFLDIGRLDNDSNASQKAFYRIAVVFANAYTDAISDNVKRTNEKKRNDGTILGPAPIGYLNLPRAANQKEAVVGFDPDRDWIVRKMFEEYSTGNCSMAEVRISATNRGLRTRLGNKKLEKSQMEHILSNPFYYGFMKSKGKLYPHVYPKLITKELFDKCQDVRFNRSKPKYKRTMREYIFRGLLRCNHCNCGYSPELHKGKYIYMRPIKDKKENNCPHCNYIREEVILKQIGDVINDFNIPDSLLNQIQHNLESLINEEAKTQKQHLSSLIAKKNKIISKQQRNKDCLLDCTITKEEYEENKIQLIQELNEIENLIKDVGEVNEIFKIQANTIFNLASRIYELFKSSESDEKRDIIRLIFPNLRLEAEKLVFTMAKPFDAMLKMGCCTTWLPNLEEFRIFYPQINLTMNEKMYFEFEHRLVA